MLPERVRSLYERWDGTIAPPRDAATVILLRDGDEGPETFLLRRQSSMRFAAGMAVFPGGGVGESDYRPVPWHGPPPAVWADRFGCPAPLAGALVVAAVRELFEETGVLLAGAGRPGLAPKDDQTFDAFLADRALPIRADLLGPWAHWITPEYEPHRYDTRFFVAVLPGGQSARSLTSEATDGDWVPVAGALRAVEDGSLAMMAPTRHTLTELVGKDTQQILAEAARRPLPTVLPHVVEVDGQLVFERPGVDA